MQRKMYVIFCTLTFALILNGCATQGKSAGLGGLIGATGGAALGGIADPRKKGEYRTRNVVVGATIGGMADLIAGSALHDEIKERGQPLKDLWHKFFTTRSYSRNSRIWHCFVEDGYFRPHESKMLPDVLILGNRSLVELERRGIVAVAKPHLGQFDHDEKAANIILSLEQEKVLDGFTTEAELKRKNWLWMKTTQDGKDAKFPDLTLQLSSPAKFRTVALEIEQSKKTFDRYKKVMNSYAVTKEIEIVVFIANQQYIFNSISRAMKEVSYPSWDRPVGFGEMEAWLKNPLTAPIYMSRGVESIEQWMNEKRERVG